LVNVKLSLRLTELHTIKIYGEVHTLLPFITGVKITGSHLTGGQVGHRSGLDAVA